METGIDPNVLAVIAALLINALTAVLNVGKYTAKLESIATVIVDLRADLNELHDALEELIVEVTRLKTIEEERSKQYVRAHPEGRP